MSQTCNFGPLANSLIRDRLICGILDKHLRERMLRNEELTLDKALTMGRIAENTASQLKSLKVVDSTIEINQNTTNQSDSQEVDCVKRKPSNSITKIIRNCYFCKRDHPRRKCPAYGQQCHDCNKNNHYGGSKACKINRRDVNTINSAESTTWDESFFIGHVQKTGNENKWTVNMELNGKSLSFFIDSGALANILPEKHYHSFNPRPKLNKTNVKLLSYTGKIETLGCISLNIHYNSKVYNLPFYIVRDAGRSLLGLDSSLELGLIKRIYDIEYIDHNRVQKLLVQFKDLFHGIGRLPGEYHITTKKGLPRIAHASRRFPRPLITELKAELDRMVEAKVIIPVKQPILVCSSMVVVEKPQTGELRICLDARELNQYILRENCQIPTKEEIQAEIKDAKVFSKIDASAAFWHLKLDEICSSLCTFNTPFGRFKYLVMPYGIKSVSEIFHRELRQLFEDEGSY